MPATDTDQPAIQGVAVKGAMRPRYEEVLSAPALAFLAGLHRRFDAERRRLLDLRRARQQRFDDGELPDFLVETREIRSGDWTVASIPADLQDRRVEITGPVDRKMIVNALNSGASVFMADFEDATSPTWDNLVDGQINLKDRWAGRLGFTDAGSGKEYRLCDTPAVLLVRPRGWHLDEAHVEIDGAPVSGALFDFALYVFHNAKAALAQGSGPYVYLPKLENHREARLWNDVFVFAQEALDIPVGTIKATVLVETLPAAFEMDEILYEMRDHITGLNCGRWDYIFSFIKTFRNHPSFLLPDRGKVMMGEAFLRAYSLLLVRTCHRRGAFAMGGMAAQIPNRRDPQANEAALAKVRADKEREAGDGYDGTWVAHPDLVPVAREVFDALMDGPNQLGVLRDDVSVDQKDLLRIHKGGASEAGMRENIRVGIQYIEAWLGGRGAVPLYNLMEDAATAEISRAQLWQWRKHGASITGGPKIDDDLLARLFEEEMDKIRDAMGDELYAMSAFDEARALFWDMTVSDDFQEFLTLPAYERISADAA